MNRATRINSFIRRSGGLATGLAHGTLLCVGLMGMTPITVDGTTATRVSYVDTRNADTRAADLRTTVAALPMAIESAPRSTPLSRLAVPAQAAPRAKESVRKAPIGLRTPASATQVASVALATQVAAADDSDDELSAEMAKVRDWVAERYGVSEKALEPALAAAEASASKLGFDPLLLVAIMAVESSFNPRAVSNMGAQGLMQVIPRYHQDKIGNKRGKYALFDPELNVHVGSLVLHEGLQRYGSLQRALQYYNGSLRDPKASYTRKVLSVKKRLLSAAGRGPMPSRTTLSSAS